MKTIYDLIYDNILLKNIVTIALVLGFLYMNIVNGETPQTYDTVMIAVIGFYFGTRTPQESVKYVASKVI